MIPFNFVNIAVSCFHACGCRRLPCVPEVFVARGRQKYFTVHETWPTPETAQEKPLAPRVIAAMALPLIRCRWRIRSYDRESYSLFGATWSVLRCKQHWKLSSQCIGSSYRWSRKEWRGHNNFCDRQEDLHCSSWLVQSGESERQKIRAAMWITTAAF